MSRPIARLPLHSRDPRAGRVAGLSRHVGHRSGLSRSRGHFTGLSRSGRDPRPLDAGFEAIGRHRRSINATLATVLLAAGLLASWAIWPNGVG